MSYAKILGKMLRRIGKRTRASGMEEMGKIIQKNGLGALKKIDKTKVGKGKKGGGKSKGKKGRFSKLVADPRFYIALGMLPEAAFGASLLMKERRKSQMMKFRKQREERKHKEIFQKEAELEQRRQRELRKVREIELNRMKLLRKEYPEIFQRLSKIGLIEKKERRVGRPRKKGRKQEWFSVRRGNKLYRIRRGARKKQGSA